MTGEGRWWLGVVERPIQQNTMTGEGRWLGAVGRPIQEDTMTGEGRG